ncbi:MAG: hypothetical protein IKP10_06910 [Clostridia bacterium]|nr:hypothetical protein [Clostridia bacterium]
MRASVIGIGSNSVRMMTAEIAGTVGIRLRRGRAATRLFAGLDSQRRLSSEAMQRTAAAAMTMAAQAREAGAETVRIFATSATRDAVNGPEFLGMLKDLTGAEAEVLSGEDEAALSFIGASDGGHCGVIDIGGGSTELVVGDGMDVHASCSCQMGAVRLFRLISINGHQDVDTAVMAARGVLRDGIESHPALLAEKPDRWWGTGGTFTALAALALNVAWTDRTDMHRTMLSRARIRAEAESLAEMPLEERLRLPSLQPGRADIVVHGICILLACMEELGIERITVSECGNLDGYLKRCFHLIELRNP